jgi:ubiquinone/menaquinone biosynthesis C-methylase UbiE
MQEWYKESFGKDYLVIYKHRDLQGAANEVKKMAAWLHLPRGAEVLDLCCGMGRHSMALSECGYRVTAIDLSEALLAEAQRYDSEGRIAFIQGDMRAVPLHKPFDAVVNLFTSFGYFDNDADHVKVLFEICRLLKPGGRFIIDYLNPSFVSKHLVHYSERIDGELTIRESRSIEEGFVRKRIVIMEEGSEARNYMEQVRLLNLAWFQSQFKAVGLELKNVYGSVDGEPYTPELSPRMIMVGIKEEVTA